MTCFEPTSFRCELGSWNQKIYFLSNTHKFCTLSYVGFVLDFAAPQGSTYRLRKKFSIFFSLFGKVKEALCKKS